MALSPILKQNLERDYHSTIVSDKYLSAGSNGSVSHVRFENGTDICVKSIVIDNVSARKDYEISRIVYGEKNVHSYEIDGYIHFTIPFFKGEDLQKIIKNQAKYTLQTRLNIFLQLVLAIKEIHKCGVLHRDLKPENILADVTTDPIEVHVIDFGRSEIINDKAGKAVAHPENLSLRSTTPLQNSFFYFFFQLARKYQMQTAPEYTSLNSHLHGYQVEAENVGLRSEYHSLANVFKLLISDEKELVALANGVLYANNEDRTQAFYLMLRSIHGKLSSERSLQPSLA